MERVEATEYYAQESLVDFSKAVLCSLGVPRVSANEVAHCLLSANLRGVDSHGIVRLPVYAMRLQAGVVKADPRLTVTNRDRAVRVVDGDNGLGPVVGSFAVGEAIQAAKTFGVGAVTARRSNHYGAAVHYLKRAVASGCIALTCSNAPPNMAPFGGRSRFLGTNPLAVGVPTSHEPLLFDMATSVVARGKIILAAQRDETIPSGWAVDSAGQPTVDPHAALAGAVLPFGGAKGSALSLILDILSGVLAGAAFGQYLHTLEDLTQPQDVGHFFLVLDVASFMPLKTFLARADDLLGQLRATPTAPGYDQVLAPGELEARCATLRLREGCPLSPDVVTQLQRLGENLGVELPPALPSHPIQEVTS